MPGTSIHSVVLSFQAPLSDPQRQAVNLSSQHEDLLTRRELKYEYCSAGIRKTALTLEESLPFMSAI